MMTFAKLSIDLRPEYNEMACSVPFSVQRVAVFVNKLEPQGGVLDMSLELDFYAMMVQPMRDELTQFGFRELRSVDDVDGVLKDQKGTALVVVNSICGCAGGIARPGAGLAMQGEKKPDHLVTVFAGQDKDATTRAREYFEGNPPSSPSMWFFKDGQLVDALHRSDIEGTSADHVASRLKGMFEKYC
jgi:putative YphP/YqiW family bacilliredoxin